MTNETTAPVQSLHDQIMRLPCIPPKDANVNQMIAYKSGHRDARHAAAELAAAHETDAQVTVPPTPAQQPVAWQDPDNLERMCSARCMDDAKRVGGATLMAVLPLTRPLYAAPPAQHPVAWVLFHHGEVAYDRDEPIISNEPCDELDESYEWRRVYAAPPAQQVEQPASHELLPDEIHQIAFEEGQPAENGDGYWFTAEEFDLFVDRLLTRAAQPAQQSQWVKASERLPNPEEHPRVLIYTDGVDFQGEQFFDVRAEQLNESYYETPDDQPEVCQHATHWSPLPIPTGDTAAPEQSGFRLGYREGATVFASYLLDNCERETVYEENLQQWLDDMLRTHPATPAPEQAEQDAVKVPRELLCRITRNGGVDTLLAIDELHALLGGGA